MHALIWRTLKDPTTRRSTTILKLAIIGFGEAGSAIAQGLRSEAALADLAIACFDVKSFEPETAAEIDA